MPRSDRTPTDPAASAPDHDPAPAVRSLPRPTRSVADFRPYPTAPTRTRRSPANNAGGDSSRLHRPPTPPTVWFTPPATAEELPSAATAAASANATGGTGEGWPQEVLARVVTSFSDSGAVVLVLPWPDLDDSPTGADPNGSGRRDAGVEAAMVTVMTLGRFPVAVRAASRSGYPDHLETVPSPGGPIRRETALLVTAMPARATDCGAAADAVARRAACSLRIGGILAVLTHCHWDGGELCDPTGPMVASAQSADLLYLQHIVAIHLSPRDSRFRDPLGHASAWGVHRRVHSDVLVFAQPHDHEALPEQPSRPVPAGSSDPRVKGRP